MEETKKCPYCAEEINKDAIMCKHCRMSLVTQNTKQNSNRIISTIVILAISAFAIYYFFIRTTPESQCEKAIAKMSTFETSKMSITECISLSKR